MTGGVAGGVGGRTGDEGGGIVDLMDFLDVEMAGRGVCVSGDFLTDGEEDFFAGVLGVSFGDDMETGLNTADDLLDEDAEFEVEEPDFLDRIFIQNSFPKLG